MDPMSTGAAPRTSPTSGSPTSLAPRGRRRGLGNRRHTHRLSSSLQQEQEERPPQRTPLPQSHILTRSFSHPPIVVLPTEDPVPSRRNLEISESSRARATSAEEPRTGSSELPGARDSEDTTCAIISSVMARYRAGSDPPGERGSTAVSERDHAAPNLTGYPQDQMPTIRLTPHQDPRSNRPSLAFPPTSRTLPHEDCVIRVGRYSERDTNPNPPPHLPSSAPVGFKSKVVSRRHCEFWCSNGQWYVKDVKSSSGTFLNHIRLSQPSMESKPFPVNDGDVVQLGIDFRGGEEMIFRCVKIRVECNRAWQKSLNQFNTTTHKRLRDLGKSAASKDSDASSAHSSECSICLMSIAPCQSLFVAPCSHVWHYKCIRPILNDPKTYPQFLCPNCRAVSDLEADVEDPNVRWEDDDIEEVSKVDGAGANAAMAMPETSEGDEALVSSTARLLSIRNGIDEPSQPIPVPQNSATTTADQASLLSRRNFANSTTFSLGPDFAQSIAASNYLRPSPPSRSLFHDEGATPNSESASIPTIELLRDGPMTPTNDAGPFVFDGSAGRAATAVGQNAGSSA